MCRYTPQDSTTTSYSDFIAAVEAGDVEQVHFTDTQINYTKEEGGKILYFKTGIVDNPSLPQLLQEKGVSYGAEIPEKPNVFLSLLLNYGVPMLIFSLIGKRISKNMAGKLGASGLNIRGSEVAKVYTPDDDKKTFADVAGQEEAKESLVEIIDYLNNPGKYEKMGLNVLRECYW